jgi:hypothetical protein
VNFLACDREQVFLMPPDPRDWLGQGHLAWFVLASVEEMDLEAFYGVYRQDGWGRAAFEPGMMVALLMYAYARGERLARLNPDASFDAEASVSSLRDAPVTCSAFTPGRFAAAVGLLCLAGGQQQHARGYRSLAGDPRDPDLWQPWREP